MSTPLTPPQPLSRGSILVLGIAGVCLVGTVDYLTGIEISFAIFYLIPVSLVGWASGPWDAALVSLLSAISWYFADVSGGHVYVHRVIPVWNAAMRFGIFLSLGIVLPQLKTALAREKEAHAAAALSTQTKSNFMANMSHEIRTPLNAILGVADVLSDTTLTADQQRLLDLQRSEGEQLRRLVNDILDLSKLEAGRMQLEERPFHLRELLGKVCSALAPLARAKGLALEWTVAPEVGHAWLGDEFRLRQILANLIGNAIKFTERGQVRVRVEAPPAPSPGLTLRFAVADTGPGILPEHQTDLFQRFSQRTSSSPRRHGGSGLGLSIVKGLVECMKGQVWFTTRPGQGSSFFVDLPLAPSGETTVISSKTPAMSPIPQAPLTHWDRPVRMLLVEDYEPNRRILCEFLHGAGFAVETAVNGLQAFEKFKRAAFNLVLMDVNLPVMDGLTATRAIREWQRAQGKGLTPVLALTASALLEDRDRCLAAGCSGFLAKPIRKADLLAAISRILGVALPARQPAPGAEPPVPGRVDPEIAPLIPGFLEEMRSHTVALKAASSRGDFETARVLAHQCAGAGGSYGFKALSAVAQALEEAALRRDSLALSRQLMEWEEQLNCIASAHERTQ